MATDPTKLGTVVLATSNRGKLADFQHLFDGTPLEFQLAGDVGVDVDVEETELTFKGNALIKARYAAGQTSRAVLADDSGLAVEALDGTPGIYSARYAGPECDDDANNRKLLEAMRGVDDRRAAFVCVLALVLPDGTEITAEGRCEGAVAHEVSGSNGFGYDVLFYRDDLGRTFGEATPAEKNARSHRAAAVAALIDDLAERGLI